MFNILHNRNFCLSKISRLIKSQVRQEFNNKILSKQLRSDIWNMNHIYFIWVPLSSTQINIKNPSVEHRNMLNWEYCWTEGFLVLNWGILRGWKGVPLLCWTEGTLSDIFFRSVLWINFSTAPDNYKLLFTYQLYIFWSVGKNRTC